MSNFEDTRTMPEKVIDFFAQDISRFEISEALVITPLA